MLKMEIAACCMDCDQVKIEASRAKTIGERAVIRDLGLEHMSVTLPVIVGCEHRLVCAKYLNEPLKALPAEQLFGKESS